MAGTKLVDRVTTIGDDIRDPSSGAVVIGMPITDVVINCNVEGGDEWII